MPWFRGDCHVHSTRSGGGELTPPQLVAAARAAGLDFLAVTEHNTADTHDAWGADLPVILGQEVVTYTGHWLALGIGRGEVVDWRYGVRDGAIGRQLDRVRAAGGLCVAAHPHAPYPSGLLMYPFDGFDLVEVWNGRWTSDLPWNADNDAALAEWSRGLAAGVARGRWLPAIGNSDVHLAGQIAHPHTVVRAADLSPRALLSALAAGHSWIAGSAAVELSMQARAGDRTATLGETLKTREQATTVRVDLRGVPGGVVSFHTDRGRSHREAVPASGAGTVEWRTTAAEAMYVRVEVRHPDGYPAALTNPVILA